MGNEVDTRILDEKWNGIERGSDQWCREQVKLMVDGILDTVDVEGIRAYLFEMSHNHMDEATSYAGREIEHLMKLKFYAYDNNTNEHHWRTEVANFQGDLFSILDSNKDIVTTYRDEFLQKMWRKGVKFYKIAANENPGLIGGLKKIPKECPFTPEELADLTIDELLLKLK